ncbi:hypothetical protein AB0M02_16240 [Actinoplanes sp. NPDC051861]|uniref:hypothetical protein n=1 Tax=Actinoplanes sp. NPDC051861 TaxID=3155170 RepID=UPI00344AB5FD
MSERYDAPRSGGRAAQSRRVHDDSRDARDRGTGARGARQSPGTDTRRSGIRSDRADRPATEAATRGDRADRAATRGDRLDAAATRGDRLDAAATRGERADRAATRGDRAERAATRGDRLDAAAARKSARDERLGAAAARGDRAERAAARDDRLDAAAARKSARGERAERAAGRNVAREERVRGGKGGRVEGTAALALRVTDLEVTAAAPEPAGRPKLWVAPPAPIRAPRVTFAVAVLAVVLVGVLGILYINTKTMEQSFRLTALRKEQAALDKQQASLEQQLIQASNPGNLHAAARRLGLVVAESPAMIRLPDGKIIRTPTPGRGRLSPTAQDWLGNGNGTAPSAGAASAGTGQ